VLLGGFDAGPRLPRAIIGADNVARILGAIVPPLARICVVVKPHGVCGLTRR
jgi:hypothetical protein